jgi:hypothetical protein
MGVAVKAVGAASRNARGPPGETNALMRPRVRHKFHWSDGNHRRETTMEATMRKLRVFLVVKLKILGFRIEMTLRLHR